MSFESEGKEEEDKSLPTPVDFTYYERHRSINQLAMQHNQLLSIRLTLKFPRDHLVSDHIWVGYEIVVKVVNFLKRNENLKILKRLT